MSSAEEYRRQAAGCVLIAEETTELATRLHLMEMAKMWLQLAEQADKNSRTNLVNSEPRQQRSGNTARGTEGAPAR
jgi:hypothetical protein